METIKESLSPSQYAAVEYTDGPELIIAGAGSGKTRVLTYKIAYLLKDGYKPWSILALTFTNKAAREMKDRVAKIVGDDVARYLNMGTFHSVFLRILRAEAEAIGLQRNFSIYDDADSKALVNTIIKELGLDDKTYKVSTILSRIGAAKNSLVTPDVYMSDGQLLERDRRSGMSKTGLIYSLYAQRCRQANAIDFDDMLLFTYQLFANHPDICAKYVQRFCYVLVDEYQDTNYAQQSILTLLTKGKGNICVVGDDAQSIYAFRGANIDNILNFQNVYNGARIFKLEQNYRSTQTIVEAANSVISHNVRQIHKKVFSNNGSGEKICLNIAYSDKEEANIVCRAINEQHFKRGISYGDMAILYRTNAQSRLFEEELRRQGIPYRIYGGMSFYQHKEIKDIIAYFRLVANPNDEEALKRVINTPKRGIGNTTIDKLISASRACKLSVWTIASNPLNYNTGLSAAATKRVVAFYDMINDFSAQYRSTDAYTLGRQIIEISGIAKDIAADMSQEGLSRKDNIDEFMSALHDFVDTKREEGYEDEIYIDNFLQEIALVTDADKEADKLADGSEPKLVSLMTIHASKGLEFNTVFIVGMEENIFPSPRACESPRELEEERRLFYVAITRAEKDCFISCAKSRYQYGNMMFNQPSRFLREIDSCWLDVRGGGFASSSSYESSLKPHRSVQNTNNSVFGKHLSISRKENNNHVMQTGSHSIDVGQVVEHQRFGIGTVVAVEGTGENEKATVNFKNIGRKTLLMKFAKITLISNE